MLSSVGGGVHDGAVPGRLPRIALFIPALAVGGAEAQLVLLARALVSRGWDVRVITFESPSTAEISDLIIRTVPRARSHIATARRLRAILEADRVRVLHAYLAIAQFYAVLVRLLGWKGRLVIGVRDALPLFYHRSARNYLIDVLLFRLPFIADMYVFNSVAGLSAKGNRIPSERRRHIPNFVDVARCRPDPEARATLRALIGASPNADIIGMVANFSEYKDYETFITAAALICEELPGLYFVSIGDFHSTHGASAVEQVRQRGLSRKFHFLGPRGDAAALMPGFDVLCSSSISEGSSNAITEALASGVPVVVTDVGDSALLAGDAGIVVSPRDPRALATAITTLMKMPVAERRTMGEAGRSRVIDLYSISAVASRYENLYRDLIS